MVPHIIKMSGAAHPWRLINPERRIQMEHFRPILLSGAVTQGVVVLVVVCLFLLFSMIKIVKEYERAVIFRLGKFAGVRGPGIIIIIPIIERMEQRMDMRTIPLDVPPQDVITKDNVSIKVNAVVFFRVMDAEKAVIEVVNWYMATSQLAQTMLRSILGQAELQEILQERENLNMRLQKNLDIHTDPWGVKVSAVEIKHIDLPQEMQRSMAAQAEADRERRAKIIHADGEFQAAQRLADASEIISRNPVTIQLRFLQTLTEIASEKNSTIIFPVPVDLLASLVKKT